MNLRWTKCEGDKWCPFTSLNLTHEHFDGLKGVYIIWHGGQQPATVYVGQGNIADRIRDHRKDSNILQYLSYGLFVTWAQVGDSSLDGVERFLADTLIPKEGSLHPSVSPIAVNFPW